MEVWLEHVLYLGVVGALTVAVCDLKSARGQKLTFSFIALLAQRYYKNILGKELRRKNIRSRFGSSNSDLGGLLLRLPTVADGNGRVSEHLHLEPERVGSWQNSVPHL